MVTSSFPAKSLKVHDDNVFDARSTIPFATKRRLRKFTYNVREITTSKLFSVSMKLVL